MVTLLAVILLALTIVFAFFPNFSWYYVVSGRWGRNVMGAPSAGNLLGLRFIAVLPVLAYRFVILA
ncbi:MAG: hypothetical protein ACR2NP_07155 [Pirellulaceae bacterium]